MTRYCRCLSKTEVEVDGKTYYRCDICGAMYDKDGDFVYYADEKRYGE